jgi:hypothetical protein
MQTAAAVDIGIGWGREYVLGLHHTELALLSGQMAWGTGFSIWPIKSGRLAWIYAPNSEDIQECKNLKPKKTASRTNDGLREPTTCLNSERIRTTNPQPPHSPGPTISPIHKGKARTSARRNASRRVRSGVILISHIVITFRLVNWIPKRKCQYAKITKLQIHN